MKLPQPTQILYEFEIRQIFSPVIMPRMTNKIVLDILTTMLTYLMYFKKSFGVFFGVSERKSQFLKENIKKFNSFTCQSVINEFL